MGFSELLTTGTLGELTDNQLDAAEECHEGGERILRLINDILDVGRSRSYYLAGEIRPFSPAEMIRRVENLLSGQARREDLQLEVDIASDVPAIQSEERTFKQLVYHLILNSMDRSEPGGLVAVSVGPNGSNAVELVVTDAGGEVTEPIAPQPFEAESEERAHRTLAPPLLGLPLCATLAERLRTTLTTHTDRDGVHFRVELPIQPRV
jgi:signal transduction histidine kinase